MLSPMITNHHHILRQILELDLGPGIQAPQLQEAVARSFWECVVPDLETMFDRMVGSDQILRLDRLEIDLGSIEGADWESQFHMRLVEQLAKSLAQFQPIQSAGGGQGRGDSNLGESLRQFLFFLAHGRLPWWGGKPVEGCPEDLLPQFDLTGWTALQQLLTTNHYARIRLIDAVSDGFLETVAETWAGLQDASQVLTRLTPVALPTAAVQSWRRCFWGLLLDWISEGSPRNQGGAFMLRLLEQRDSLAGPVWSKKPPSQLRSRESLGVMAEASAPPSLHPPWQEWLEEALHARVSTERIPDTASAVPESSLRPDVLPEPQTGGTAGAETSKPGWRAEPQLQVPNTVSLPIGTGIPDMALAAPDSSLRPHALPEPRTEGTAGAGTKATHLKQDKQQGLSVRPELVEGPQMVRQAHQEWLKWVAETGEPDRQAEAQPQVPNTVEIMNPLPEGEGLNSTTLPPVSPSASGKVPPAAHRKSLALPEEGEAIYLEGAGAVILHPFLEELFRSRGLLVQRNFHDAAARHRGVHLLGLLGFGREGIPEYELLLAKLLCGLPFEEALEPAELDDDDRAACGTLLHAVLGHWTALRSGSPDWLREQFFLREGKLEAVDSGWRLTVECRIQDVLLARLPWGLGVIAPPWMEERIFVRWTE